VPGEDRVDSAAWGELSSLVVSPLRVAAIVLAVLLVTRDGSSARAPDWVKKTFMYRGDAAVALGALLGLPGRRAVVELELSQATEQMALPERQAALAGPDGGTAQSELASRTSSTVQEVVIWDPAARVIGLEGYFAEMSTALPAQAGLEWSCTSPLFSEAEIDKLPGWKPLLPKLVARPAKAMSGGALMRKIEVSLTPTEAASLQLWRIQTWDSNNLPIPRSYITLEFGRPLDARGKLSGSGASRCACRAGPSDSRGGLWGLGGVAVWVVRRRRASLTSRTPPPASPSPPSPGSAPDS